MHLPLTAVAAAALAAAATTTLMMPVALGGPAEDKGLQIATDADKADSGFLGERSTMEMVLVNAHGDEAKRKMKSLVQEGTDDGDRSVITFQWPADVKGTRMLTWTHKKGHDDQWLYLPSLKRVKRIASRNKSGAFMGSEFAYEDLGSQEPEKYSWKHLKDEAVGGRPAWVLERVPVDKKSGYSRQVVWMDQEYKGAVKIDYYDRKGELLKSAALTGYKKHGKYWRIGQIEMVNHQTRKKSRITWSDRALGEPSDADAFDPENLED